MEGQHRQIRYLSIEFNICELLCLEKFRNRDAQAITDPDHGKDPWIPGRSLHNVHEGSQGNGGAVTEFIIRHLQLGTIMVDPVREQFLHGGLGLLCLFCHGCFPFIFGINHSLIHFRESSIPNSVVNGKNWKIL